ncbi:hypothetical protein PRIPAC_85604 [Pristionchus pacificus]|uniref:Large ribosomal subunit protein P2 n=1 Tax=Pristionchus pacificus TaxID=54126 RepID=A0A454XUZ6_PRIPA|nr:hypothetical protein PRIPAC_85604 [Pristionchus pacificus]|eukprot:PDM77996.1 ribosomal protein [Pristionchus pacificus]
MKYLGAYLLANLGGNASPSAHDILNIIDISPIVVIAGPRDFGVVEALKGKTVADLISEGKKKLSSVPSGESAPVAASPAVGAASAAGPAKKEEVKEESDDDMGFGLFD